jgi:hypothetical protein
MRLLKKYIDAAEEAILSDSNNTDYSSLNCQISLDDYDCLREKWVLIQDDEINSYHQFASNGCGMHSFGFYKANNGKIYIIDGFLNEIRNVYIVTKKFQFISDLLLN